MPQMSFALWWSDGNRATTLPSSSLTLKLVCRCGLHYVWTKFQFGNYVWGELHVETHNQHIACCLFPPARRISSTYWCLTWDIRPHPGVTCRRAIGCPPRTHGRRLRRRPKPRRTTRRRPKRCRARGSRSSILPLGNLVRLRYNWDMNGCNEITITIQYIHS